ncbi:MAG: hypothetical protein P4K98_03080 [Bryobacteraceae bacterium]|nr:hypothetical protein [Bryobacteraceae bacterium]
MKVLIALFGLALCLGAADLETVKKEPDLQKRSNLALDAAMAALKDARALPAEGGSSADLQKDMDTMIEAVELSLQSLRDTGKRPNKLTSYYKRGELKTHEMQKQMENLVQALAFDNRPPAEKAQARLNVLHDEFLFGVMSGK